MLSDFDLNIKIYWPYCLDGIGNTIKKICELRLIFNIWRKKEERKGKKKIVIVNFCVCLCEAFASAGTCILGIGCCQNSLSMYQWNIALLSSIMTALGPKSEMFFLFTLKRVVCWVNKGNVLEFSCWTNVSDQQNSWTLDSMKSVKLKI